MDFRIILTVALLVVHSTLLALPGYFEPWGKDSDLLPRAEEAPISVMPEKKSDILSTLSESLIGLHQNFLSPTTGPRSNFRPTSSQYMKLAIRRHGFFKGYLMGCDRLMRENGEKWHYRTIVINQVEYNFDPTID